MPVLALPSAEAALTVPMRDLLWTCAQHKYGWTHVSRHRGQLQVADALVRRGLVSWGEGGREHHHATIAVTAAGREEVARRWPVSPLILGTYDWKTVRSTHGQWTPREGVAA